MYGYIYDIFLSQKQFTKEVIKVENTLTDLGLQGHIVRLSLISNLGHALEDLVSRGVKTIIAVGSDQLLSSLADFAPQLTNFTIGLIPIGSHRLLADMLGIPNGAAACSIISARRIKYLRLAQINAKFFIHSVVTNDTRVRVGCDSQFVASSLSEQAIISVLNRQDDGDETPNANKNTHLTVVVTPTVKPGMFRKSLPMPSTIMTTKHVCIEEPRQVELIVDGQKIIKTPVDLAPSSQTLRVIVGKNRQL